MNSPAPQVTCGDQRATWRLSPQREWAQGVRLGGQHLYPRELSHLPVSIFGCSNQECGGTSFWRTAGEELHCCAISLDFTDWGPGEQTLPLWLHGGCCVSPSARGLRLPHRLSVAGCCLSFYCSHLSGCEANLLWFWFAFSWELGKGTSFHVPISQCLSSDKYLLKSFAHLSLGYLFSYYWPLRVLYGSHVLAPHQMCENIFFAFFFHFVSYLFAFVRTWYFKGTDLIQTSQSFLYCLCHSLAISDLWQDFPCSNEKGYEGPSFCKDTKLFMRRLICMFPLRFHWGFPWPLCYFPFWKRGQGQVPFLVVWREMSL